MEQAVKDLPQRISNFVNGNFVPPVEGNYLKSFVPATGACGPEIPRSSTADVQTAVQAAHESFENVWSLTTPLYRSQMMNRIADLIEEDLEAFAILESIDNGKPLSLSRSVDIPRAVHNFRFFASAILHSKEECSSTEVSLNYVHKSPAGVAALISPWNLPLYLLTWKIAPAMAYGCTSVCKPSEFTSLTAWKLCTVFQKAGLPPGVVNMVFGDGPGAGAPLVQHPLVPLVSFTGGTATGERIYSMCAPMYKKMSLELGGKNASIVFEDADLQDAIDTTVRSCFTNSGQICLCTSRLYVHSSLYEAFVKGLKAKAEALVVGDPFDSKTNMGPLVSQQHLDKVLSYIDIAVKEGGTIVTGGKRLEGTGKYGNGYYMTPTLISNLPPLDCRTQQEEIFGPVSTITPFDTEDDAVRFANGTQFGLSACVWTNDVKRAHRMAKKLKAGTVWINCWMVRDLNMPFGGYKASGLGREGNPYSQDFFCEEQTICIKY